MTYTVTEVAKLMNVRPETVRRWIRSGKLKAALPSKKEGYVIHEADLHNMAKEHFENTNTYLKDEILELQRSVNFHREMIKFYEQHISELQRRMATRK